PEALGQPGDRVAVTHPDRLLSIEAGEKAVLAGDRDDRRPVLALRRRQDITTQLAGHELGAVADSEDRDSAAPDSAVGPRRIRVVDGVRAAGQDHRLRPAPLDLRPR